MAIQALLTESPIEGFALSIVRRLAGAAEVNFYPVFLGLLVHGLGDELAAIVGLDDARHATQSTHARQRRHHVVTSQVLPNIDGQAFSGVVVDKG